MDQCNVHFSSFFFFFRRDLWRSNENVCAHVLHLAKKNGNISAKVAARSNILLHFISITAIETSFLTFDAIVT